MILNKEELYVATIGFFDGVHQGHRYLIRQVMDEAIKRGLKSMVVTFPTHPRKILQPEFHPLLLSMADEKVSMLESEGVDVITLMNFTRELSMMSAKDFMKKLHDEYNVCVLVIGYDHKFGHNREEGFHDYVRYGKEIGVDVIQALEEPEGKYSSTAARNALLNGDIDMANAILGYPYFMEGCVVNGFHVGTKIGYPTANISLPEDKLIPKGGVYQVRVEGHLAMLNIGFRPTLNNGPKMSIEVHIFDFDEDLYGKTIKVEFLKRIRDEIKFGSVQELKQQLVKDEELCRKAL